MGPVSAVGGVASDCARNGEARQCTCGEGARVAGSNTGCVDAAPAVGDAAAAAARHREDLGRVGAGAGGKVVDVSPPPRSSEQSAAAPATDAAMTVPVSNTLPLGGAAGTPAEVAAEAAAKSALGTAAAAAQDPLGRMREHQRRKTSCYALWE